MRKLSEILSTPVVTVVRNNRIAFWVGGERHERTVASKYFSNWSVDTIRFQNESFLIDSGVDIHNPVN